MANGNYGQQGQGRFEELEDHGQQVAEGKAPGEEGESRSFGLFLNGILDQQVSRGVRPTGLFAAQALFDARTMRAVPLFGPIKLSCPSAHRTR
jgi:hypothetical protein